MKKSLFSFIIITHSLLIGLNLVAQQEVDYAELESYIEKARESFEVPGIAVGIYKNGRIVMNQGFGVTSTESKQKVDKETIFGIASCSKAFTTASLAILVDKGLLNWSDKVIDCLPDFQAYDPFITKELRIDDLGIYSGTVVIITEKKSLKEYGLGKMNIVYEKDMDIKM